MNGALHGVTRVLLGSIGLLLGASSLPAQPIPQGQGPPNAQAFEAEGRIMGLAPGGIQMVTERNIPWVVQIIPRRTVVKITGTAEPGFLRPGICVRFSGAVNDKGVLSEELSELEIYTPEGRNSMGTFPSGADENAKPIGKLSEGTYDFRGKVVTYRDGELTVVAGKKITGKVATDAKVNVNVSDLRFTQPDDTIKVIGWERTPPQAPQPGTAVGTEVTIELAKPLAAVPQKGSHRTSKSSKKREPEEPGVNLDDPFNVGGKK